MAKRNVIQKIIQRYRIRSEIKSHRKNIPQLPPPDERLKIKVAEASEEIKSYF